MPLGDQLGAIDPQGVMDDMMRTNAPAFTPPSGPVDPQDFMDRMIRSNVYGGQGRQPKSAPPDDPSKYGRDPSAPADLAKFGRDPAPPDAQPAEPPTPPTPEWGGYGSVLGRSSAQGLSTLAGTAIKAAALGTDLGGSAEAAMSAGAVGEDPIPVTPVPPDQNPITKAGAAVQQWGEKQFPLTPTEQQSFTAKFGEGAPAVVGLTALGLLSPGAAIAGGAALFGLSGAGSAYDAANASIEDQIAKARKAGDDKTADQLAATKADKAAAAAGLSGGLNAALAATRLDLVLQPFEKFLPQMSGWAARTLAQAGQNGLEFAGIGEAQEYLGQQIAKLYDPNAGYSFDPKRFAADFATGGLVGALHGAIASKQAADQAQPGAQPGVQPGQPGVPPGTGPLSDADLQAGMAAAQGRGQGPPQPPPLHPDMSDDQILRAAQFPDIDGMTDAEKTKVADQFREHANEEALRKSGISDADLASMSAADKDKAAEGLHPGDAEWTKYSGAFPDATRTFNPDGSQRFASTGDTTAPPPFDHEGPIPSADATPEEEAAWRQAAGASNGASGASNTGPGSSKRAGNEPFRPIPGTDGQPFSGFTSSDDPRYKDENGNFDHRAYDRDNYARSYDTHGNRIDPTPDDPWRAWEPKFRAGHEDEQEFKVEPDPTDPNSQTFEQRARDFALKREAARAQARQEEAAARQAATSPEQRRRTTLENQAGAFGEHGADEIKSWSDQQLKDYVDEKVNPKVRLADDDTVLRRAGVTPEEAAAMSPEERAKTADEARSYGVHAGEEPPVPGTRDAPINLRTGADVARAAAVASQGHTPAQGEANNVQRGHAVWPQEAKDPLGMTLEVPAGGVRRGTVPGTGEAWETTHPHAYGEFKDLPDAADGMKPDVIVGDHPGAPSVFVIDEVDPKTGAYRQSKSFVGFQTPQDAIASYAGISSKSADHIGGMRAFGRQEFVAFARAGGLSKPVSEAMENRAKAGQVDKEVNKPAEAAESTHYNVSPEEHRAAVEGALRNAGVDPASVLPEDIDRAAELHAAGATPEEAFPTAVLQGLVNDGHLTEDDIAKAIGNENAQELLHSGNGSERGVRPAQERPGAGGKAAAAAAAEQRPQRSENGAKPSGGSAEAAENAKPEAGKPVRAAEAAESNAGGGAAGAEAGRGAPDHAAGGKRNAADHEKPAGGKPESGVRGAEHEPAGNAASAALIGERVTSIPEHSVTAADGTKVKTVPVVVEAKDLIASSDAGYDKALQPRQRERAASQAQIREIATRLDPERLGYSAEADRGAPIVGPDRMVESGNGRVAALRALYGVPNAPNAKRYRAWLKAQGVDTSKFKEPILVRQRVTQMTPEERQAFTVAANQAATLSMSAPERALADAKHLTPSMLGRIEDASNLTAAANRGFVRAFVASIPASERGALTDADGHLSSEGVTRARNAVLAKAYGDADVISRITESTDDDVKSISNALVMAAPQWAAMRSDIEAGRVRADVDDTEALMEAVKKTADLRTRGGKLGDYLAQQDAFNQIPAAVESWMRMFYDPSGKRAAAAPRIAEGLRFYAEQASQVSTDKGLDLGTPELTAKEIQNAALAKAQGVPIGGRGAGARPHGEARGAGAGRPELGESGGRPGEPDHGGGKPGRLGLADNDRDLFASTEPGAEGKPQSIIPGTERISSAELAKRRAAEPLKPKKAQKPADEGLFGDAGKQTDLVDMARAKAKEPEPPPAAKPAAPAKEAKAPETGPSDSGDRALLAGLPDGSHFIDGRGQLGRGKFGVETPDGRMIGNLHVSKADAVKEAKGILSQRADAAEQKAERATKLKALADRLIAGGEPSDADLRLLDLKPGSGLKWFIPSAAELFGVSSREVRPYIADLIHVGHSDMGAKLESVPTKKALAAIARGLAEKESPTLLGLAEPENDFTARAPRTSGVPIEARTPLARHASDAAIKADPNYRAAKGGDPAAALRLVANHITPEMVEQARKQFGADATYLPVISKEASGHNQIPRALAEYYAAKTEAQSAIGIEQADQAFHTGAGAMERIAVRPQFSGDVTPGARYVLADDVSVMGSTLAELAHHIQSNGGKVVGVVTLVNASRSGVLVPKKAQVREIERRFGDVVRNEFGIEPSALTGDEARHLLDFRDVDALRARRIAALRQRGERLHAKGIGPEGLGPTAEEEGSGAPKGAASDSGPGFAEPGSDRGAPNVLQRAPTLRQYPAPVGTLFDKPREPTGGRLDENDGGGTRSLDSGVETSREGEGGDVKGFVEGARDLKPPVLAPGHRPIPPSTIPAQAIGPFKRQPHGPIAKQAQDYVVAQGRATGNEHLIAIDDKGKVVGTNEGTSRFVGIEGALSKALDDPKNSVVIHHNHPSDTGLSAADIGMLGSPGLTAIWAHGHGGNVARASLTPHAASRLAKLGTPVQVRAGIYKMANAVLNSVFTPIQKAINEHRVSMDDAMRVSQEIVARALQRGGVIEYHTNADVDHIIDELNLDPYIEKAARAAAGVLNVPGFRPAGELRDDGRAKSLQHPGDAGASFERGRSVAGTVQQQAAPAPNRPQVGRAQAQAYRQPEQLRLLDPAPGGAGAGAPPPGATATTTAPPAPRPLRPVTGALVKTAPAKAFKNFWTSTFQPELVSDRAFAADPLFAKYKAASVQEKDAIYHQSEKDWDYWNKRPDSERIRFLDDMETAGFGAIPPDREQAAMAKRYRTMLDANWAEEKKYGSQAAFVEDYFPHVWEKPSEWEAYAASKTAQLGPTWFQKKRTIDYITDGLAAGMKLKFTNPADIVTHRLLSGVDMRQRMQLLQDLKRMGLAWEGAQGGEHLVRRGWRAINAPDRKQWVIHPDAQLLWKNAVEAKGLWQAEHVGGSLFRGWMALKNVWVPVKLALSAFHPLHVLHINYSDGMARAFGDVMQGKDPIAALRSLGQGFVGPMTAAPGASTGAIAGALLGSATPIGPYWGGLAGSFAGAAAYGAAKRFGMPAVPHLGATARQGWVKRPAAQTPLDKANNALMTEGGFVPQLAEQQKIAASRQLAVAWQKVLRKEAGVSDWRKLITSSLRRPIEALQKPIFEEWIPNVKTAAYLHEAAAVLRRNPGLLNDDVQRGIALRGIAQQIDARFGEKFYGSMFWNRYLKDAAIGSFLSLGWNQGFVHQFGGAAMQAITRPAGLLPAFKPTPGRVTRRKSTNAISFALAYLGSAALISGLMSLAYTGQQPEGLDFAFPRTGDLNPDGTPRRLTNMFYSREAFMLKKHVEERGGNWLSGAWEMLTNKLMYEPFKELADNRDYYGYNVYDENAPIYKQMWQAFQHTMGDQTNPMSISGAKHAAELSGKPFPTFEETIADPSRLWESLNAKGVGESVMGFGPAPGYLEKSAIQNRIGYLYGEHVAPAERTYDEGLKSPDKMSARTEIMVARQNKDQKALNEAYARGRAAGLTPTYMNNLAKSPTDIYLFSRLPDADQKAILRDANPDEYNRYFPKAKQTVKTDIYRSRGLGAAVSP